MNPILVPLRNGILLTQAAHDTFLAQDVPGGVDIMYINNASQDGTAEWLGTLSDVMVIHNTVPMSVAQSWNQGLRWWFARGAEYVLVCNNDIELRPDTYRWLLASGGLFVTAVGSADKTKILPPYIAPDLTKIRKHPDYSTYLIRKEAWVKLEQFDEAYQGGYVEDAAAHLKLFQLGIEPYCIELPFYHLGAGTIKCASAEEKVAIVAQADRNRALFKQRHGVDVGSDEYYALFNNSRPPS